MHSPKSIKKRFKKETNELIECSILWWRHQTEDPDGEKYYESRSLPTGPIGEAPDYYQISVSSNVKENSCQREYITT